LAEEDDFELVSDEVLGGWGCGEFFDSAHNSYQELIRAHIRVARASIYPRRYSKAGCLSARKLQPLLPQLHRIGP